MLHRSDFPRSGWVISESLCPDSGVRFWSVRAQDLAGVRFPCGV